jgi:TPR repeat protein/uncharacterized protein YktA (UPF0223 family)
MSAFIVKILLWSVVWALWYAMREKKDNLKFKEAVELLYKDGGGKEEALQAYDLFQEIIQDKKTSPQEKHLAKYYSLIIYWSYDEIPKRSVQEVYDEFSMLSQSKHLSKEQREYCALKNFVLEIRSYIAPQRERQKLKEDLQAFIDSNPQRPSDLFYANHLMGTLMFYENESADMTEVKKIFKESSEYAWNNDELNLEALYYLAEIELKQKPMDELADSFDLESIYKKNLDNSHLSYSENINVHLRLVQIKRISLKDKKPDYKGARRLLLGLYKKVDTYDKPIVLKYLAQMEFKGEGTKNRNFKAAEQYALEGLQCEDIPDHFVASFLFILGNIELSDERMDYKKARLHFEKILEFPIENTIEEDWVLALYFLGRMDLQGLGILRPNLKVAQERLSKVLEYRSYIDGGIAGEVREALADLKYFDLHPL